MNSDYYWILYSVSGSYIEEIIDVHPLDYTDDIRSYYNKKDENDYDYKSPDEIVLLNWKSVEKHHYINFIDKQG